LSAWARGLDRRHSTNRLALEGSSPITHFLVALRLTGRLAAALGVLTRGDVGNFPTCFEIAAHGTDGLVVDLGSLRDCPIGFLGRRLDQLGDQLALLLGGEMAATNVGADYVGIGISAGLDLPARGCAVDPLLLP
jgi:hypothetical protein